MGSGIACKCSRAIPEVPGRGSGGWRGGVGKGSGRVETACCWCFDGNGAGDDGHRLGEGPATAQAATDGQGDAGIASRSIGDIGRVSGGRGSRGGAVEVPAISQSAGAGSLVGEIQQVGGCTGGGHLVRCKLRLNARDHSEIAAIGGRIGTPCGVRNGQTYVEVAGCGIGMGGGGVTAAGSIAEGPGIGGNRALPRRGIVGELGIGR